MEFKLPYWVSNGGDGSANVHFERTLNIAKKLCEEQDEGWGENSGDVIHLKVDDGKLYYRGFVSDDGYKASWIEVTEGR